MKPIITLFISLLLTVNAFNQNSITGIVTNKAGKALPGAVVMLKGSYDGTITDTLGNFSIQTALTGAQTLLVKFTGYDTQVITVNLSNTDTLINFKMVETFNELNAVTITAGAFEASDEKKAVALNSLDMITVPGAQGNVISALQFLPGTSTNGESGKLFVRGGSSRESQTYIDGTLVPVAYNPSAPNTAVRSKFNPFMFSGTVFSTGGFSAEYGQALSSVLLLETKGLQEKDQLDISILSVGLGLAVTKKWKTGAVTISHDYTNLGPYFKLVPQNIGWLKSPVSNSSAISVRQKTKKGQLKLYATYNSGGFQLSRRDLNQPNQFNTYNLSNKNTYNNLSYKGIIGNKWILKTGLSTTFNTDNIGIGSNSTFTEQINQAHLKAVVSKRIVKKVHLKIGAESFLNNYSQVFQSSELINEVAYKGITVGSFAEANIHLSKKLVARIGARYEWDNYLEKGNFSPRLSMAYQLSENSQTALACGRFYQKPTNNQLIYTNNLDFEYADQLMLNYQWSKNKRTLRAEVYVKKYNDLVKFTDAPFYSPEHYTNNGSGYAGGVDLFFRDKKTIRNGDYWISYSFLDTKRDELNYKNAAVPTYASKHNLSVVYKHWISKWRSLVGASYSYASPRFYNDPNSSEFNNERMAAFHSLNLNWSFLYRENVIFYTSVSNVLGQQQNFGYQYATTPNADGIYEKELIKPAAPRFFVIGCFITLSKSGTKNQLDKIN